MLFIFYFFFFWCEVNEKKEKVKSEEGFIQEKEMDNDSSSILAFSFAVIPSSLLLALILLYFTNLGFTKKMEERHRKRAKETRLKASLGGFFTLGSQTKESLRRDFDLIDFYFREIEAL